MEGDNERRDATVFAFFDFRDSDFSSFPDFTSLFRIFSLVFSLSNIASGGMIGKLEDLLFLVASILTPY